MTNIVNKNCLFSCAFVAIFISYFNQCDSRIILENEGSPLVKLDQGSYVGSIRSSRQENYFFEFLGVRYAQSVRRFEIPQLISAANESTAEPLQAKKIPPVCPQAFTPELTFDDEDCLFLNVFVPMRKSHSKDGFPVMVWFHGGAFIFGSGSSYEPQYFLDEDVILITVNYRLGALGFLSRGDNVIPGNLGLKDQIVALKWVQKNIQYFGGDNKRVTIFGNSAGGASVQYLMLSPLGKGLFQSAIMQSGSVANLWAFDDRPRAISKAKRLSDRLGCNFGSSTELLECLRSKSVKEILEAQGQLYLWNRSPVAIFSPTIEEVGSSEMAFLTEHPLDLLERKEFTKVPILTGFVENEGLSIFSSSLIKDKKHLNDLNSNFFQVAPIAFEYSSWFQEEYFDEVSAAIREFYFKDNPIGQETFQNLTNLCSDAFFVHGVWTSVLAHATEKPDVYAYVSSFIDESSNSLTQLVTGDKKLIGVAHGDELQYLFGVKELFPFDSPQSVRAEEFSKRLVKLWASFAQHRKPKATWGTSKKWPSISRAQLNGEKPFLWYELNEDTKILENPFIERKRFWDKLMKKYSKRGVLSKKTEL